ncbi:MAG: hypothetical protein ABIY52_16065 [Gemmatimonadaceae bacterium]
MSAVVRQTYIISDLHLGGVYPEPGSNDRGFRICTHASAVSDFVDALTAKPVDNPAIELIVNGDLVDFLAERDDEGTADAWSAFTFEQPSARKKLDAIIERDKGVFDSLARYLAKGHRLVILLGNHDIELAMPSVRDGLAKALGVTKGSDYELIRDGEGYLVGDTLVEHGNRYDSFNFVDYGKLQGHCQWISRNQGHESAAFPPPPGSQMVANIINPIKLHYKFIDLLKPETGAVVPLLLTLEPGYRGLLGKVSLIAMQARGAVKLAVTGKAPAPAPAQSAPKASPSGGFEDDAPMTSDISSGGGPMTEEAALKAMLEEHIDADAHELRALAVGEEHLLTSDISSGGDLVSHIWGMAKLLLSPASDAVHTRLDALASAFKSLQDDRTFDQSIETAPEYLDAATALASNGIKHVVFGHTHMAKKIPLPSGGFYLNSGTWADVMKFPSDLLSGTKDESRARLSAFVDQISKGDFSTFTLFHPTYVRLDLDAGGVTSPELLQYENAASV